MGAPSGAPFSMEGQIVVGSPFDDLRQLVAEFPNADTQASESVRKGLAARPVYGIEDGFAGLLCWLAEWQGNPVPEAKDIHLCLLASSYRHGPAPNFVTAEIHRATKGRAVLNPLCVKSGLGLRVLELGQDIPHDITPANPVWTERDCMASVAFGMEATAAGGDLLGLSGLAPGADLAARSVAARLYGCEAGDAAELLAQAPDAHDPLEVLRTFGGREIAAILGGLVAARSRRLPVLIEGWSALAAVAILKALKTDAADHVRLAGLSDRKQIPLVSALSMEPMIGVVTGAGAGAGLALAADLVVASTSLIAIPELKS